MRFPRIFAADAVQLAAGAQRVLDLSQFQNEGDFPVALHWLGYHLDGTLDDEPRVQIRPTNGRPWSKDPIPLYMLGNDFRSTYDADGQHLRWYFEHPYWIAPSDSLLVQLYNGGALARYAGIGFVGIKDTEAELPKEFWQPRVLWSRLTNVADQAERTFDVEDLRNWADSPMLVDSIFFGGQRNDTGLTATFDYDDLKVRIMIGDDQITKRHQYRYLGQLRSKWTGRIHVPGFKLEPHTKVQVQVVNNTGAVLDTLDCAIFGSVLNRSF